MKKLLVVLLALAVLGMAVSAEAKLSVGAWGRGWFSPIGSDGTDQIVQAGPSWGGGAARVGVSFNGSSDNVGFSWNPGVDGKSMNAVCDQAKIFAKLNDMVTVQVGVIQGDVLRGKIGDFGDVCPSGGGEDDIFARFNPTGLLLDLTPAPGIYLGAALGVPSTNLVSDEFKAIQVGAGYTIEGMGMIRAQYIGTATSGAKGTINAAFAFTGAEGVLVDAGVKYNLDSNIPIGVNVAAKYNKDALGIYVRVGANVAGDSAVYQLALKGGLGLYYTVAAPASVGVEVGYTGKCNTKVIPTTDTTNYESMDLFPQVKLGYSNGYLKVGFDAQVGLNSQKMNYKLPIQLEYWF